MTSAMSAPPPVEESESEVLRKYYTENDYFLSPEGILKVLSVVVCVASAVLFLGGAGAACRGAAALAAGSGSVSLAAAAGAALLCAAVALDAPLRAPQAWLYTDIIVSSALGALLLVTAALTVFICEFRTVVDYLHGPLALAGGALVTASAVLPYAAVMRRWDAARPRAEPRRAPPTEQDA